MDYKYISQLVERYFQGETSLEEESILRTFFAQKSVPAELAAYREFFVYQKQEVCDDVLGDDFDERMLAAIAEQEERSEKSAEMRPVVMNPVMTFTERLKPLFKAAAVVAIVLTLGNAAQVPFMDKTADPTNIASGYEEVHRGNSVALNDTAVIDSAKQNKAVEVPVPIIK